MPRSRTASLARGVLLVLGAALLAACVTAQTGSEITAKERAQYLQFAGPPIRSFTYLGHYYTWKPLGRQQLVLWTDINDAYLINLLSPCVGLEFANRVRLTSAAHTVTRRIDSVVLDSQHCFISEIRPIDYLAMKRQLHTLP